MLKNFLAIAWRNLIKNKASSFINICGLATGMAAAILIGLWIWDEFSFDTYHKNYDRIASVMESDLYNGTVNTGSTIPLPLDAELRKNYQNDFKHIAIASWTEKHVLANGNKKITYSGNFMGAAAPEMFSLNMLRGTRNGLKGPSSMLISQSVAEALFGNADPLNQIIAFDNKTNFKVSGVYEDLPASTTLQDVSFIGPWDYYINSPENGRSMTDWNDNSLFMYVQIADHADMEKLSAKIKNIKLDNLDPDKAQSKPEIFLHPMSKWHLYSEFKNGVNTGGAIQYVWLFGIIGMFVLLLACINFMNLSTARSEKRAKEVGIRKAIGSVRGQLITQFYCESFLVAMLAFIVSILFVQLMLPWFNNIASKNIHVPWNNLSFWLMGIGFTVFTGLVAGSYPALYLSSFKPVKVLKGTFKAGPMAVIPRKVLVIAQFTVSVVLIIGTIVVYKQILFAKDRPVGYDREGLINIEVTNNDLHKSFAVVRSDLLQSGSVIEAAESSSSTTGINNDRADLNWQGKDFSVKSSFGWIGVSPEYGKTVGWRFIDGRDFSGQSVQDSLSIVLNESAAKYMGFKNPVGQIVRIGNRDLTVIGVVKDMVMSSPYDPGKQTVFHIGSGHFDNVLIKINPDRSAREALSKIEAVCKAYSPSVPFSFRFADDEYAKKFSNEERTGKLASIFALLAIFISCLGLFGIASFMAEQRIKEIGVRKVLGASVASLWQLLSKDFLVMVFISLVIAIPAAYYLMSTWLQNYQYRTQMSWWIFGAAGMSALLITLLTVSFQTIKAANANPVKSLRSE